MIIFPGKKRPDTFAQRMQVMGLVIKWPDEPEIEGVFFF